MSVNYLAVDIGTQFKSPFGQESNIGSLVTLLLGSAFAVAGIILIFTFLKAGYSIIAGAGKDKPEELEKAKQSLTSALIGFGIIFVAYWIIRIIELVTGLTFITNPGI
jgi:hypothetical protein